MMTHVHELRAADVATPRELVERDWPDGVLSLYASLDVDRPDMIRAEVHEELRTALAHTADTLGEHLREQVMNLAGEAERSVASLLGTPPTHRAIAGFADPGGERETEWILMHIPTPTIAWYGEHPLVLPLLAATNEATPAGVVIASSEHVIVGEWRAGRFEQLAEWRLDIDTSEWHAYEGPVAGGVRASSSTQRDVFERRIDHERERFLADEAVPSIHALAERHNWAELVAFGEERLRAMLEANGNSNGFQFVDGGDANLVNQPAPEQEARSRRVLELARERLMLESVELLVGGEIINAAVGASSCEFAAREGAVDTLLVAVDVEEVDPAHLPRCEAIVRQVLVHGGSVRPVRGPAATLLDRHGGLAARLRY